MSETYSARAVAALTQAARTEHDFAGWLAQVLAAAAGQPSCWPDHHITLSI